MTKEKEPAAKPQPSAVDADKADAAQLVGFTKCYKADGTPVPMLDKDGNEILGIATGSALKNKGLPPKA